jgi:hypothetical protein
MNNEEETKKVVVDGVEIEEAAEEVADTVEETVAEETPTEEQA